MPARGDHQQRRQQVARIAADLVAAGGLAAATHRRIAEAAGCSTTVVSHYFTDKRDLVTATYREVGDRVATRVEAARTSEDRLVAILEALDTPFAAVDILPDPRIREELSAISNWPTIPQLFANGELIGGCDIVSEMYESGELAEALS